MTQYSFLQIIIFFFAYCFLGWIWETSYVSIRKHKFVNRGFLHGPLIPIYGFGAMAILFATLPVKDNLFLVFVCGMLGASALELVTGCAMEAIFHVRYWDYTNIPTNIKGYISLPTSIVWGFFSILMIKFIHKPIEHAVLDLSQTATEVLTVFLVMFGSMDLGVSIRDALDLKEILKHISEMESVQRAQKRMDVIAAVLDDDVENFKDRITNRLSGMEKGEYKRIKSLLERNPSAKSTRYSKLFDSFKVTIKELKRPGKNESADNK